MTSAEILASLRGAASKGVEWIKQRRERIGAKFGRKDSVVPVKSAAAPVPPRAVTLDAAIKTAAGASGEAAEKAVDAGWSALKKLVAVPTIALIVATALAFKQWVQSPISIESFTAASGSSAVLSADTIADQLKGHITEINGVSANLYETRKLGTASVPLDVKINSTEWTLANVARAFNVELASAEVSGRMFQRGDWVVLQATTLRHGEVTVDTLQVHSPVAGTSSSAAVDAHPPVAAGNPVSGATGGDPYVAQLDAAVSCLALRVMERVSPDVAANYLFTTDVLNHPDHDDQMLAAQGHRPDSCLRHDDIELYSSVANDPAAPTAARVKALVGLSLHYSNEHETYEELNMALAATAMARRAHCENLALGWLDAARCEISWFVNRERNLRAEIAAWMQLGAARSDYAATQDPIHEARARHEAIAAYQHVIALKDDYGLAYDAVGVQIDALHDTLGAFRWFKLSLHKGETPAAHLDLGWLYINRRNAFYGGVEGSPDWLAAAQVEFEEAIKMKPDYWSAHQGLGYALLEHGYMTEAIDVLKPAAIHDLADIDTRRHLASAFAGACRFTQAKAFFNTAYARYVKVGDVNNQLNTLTDWGKTLDEFGAHRAAMKQEEAVLQRNGDHIYARQFLGQIEIASGDSATVTKGIADLKTAVDSDSEKHDFVLLSYLVGLTQVGRPEEAIKVYREWSSKGLVPAIEGVAGGAPAVGVVAAGAATANAPPRNQMVRLGYAKALAAGHHWQEAVAEFDMLVANQIEYTGTDIRDLAVQAKSNNADAKALQDIERLSKAAVPEIGEHHCHDPHVSAMTPLKDVSLIDPAVVAAK